MDPIKANIIQYLQTLDAPKNKEKVLEKLIKQLEREDYVISDFSRREGMTPAELEQEAAIYVEKVLKALFEPKTEPSATLNSRRRS
jgi:predicted nucleic acid-binding protein